MGARRFKPRRRKAIKVKSAIAKKPLVKMMKAVSLKECETKQSSQYTQSSAELFHNLSYYAGNLQSTTQGVSDPEGTTTATRNRIGDEVVARGLSLKLFMNNKDDRPNVMYRIVIFRYNVLEGIAPTPLTDTYFWSGTDGNGANMNRVLDRPNGDRIKVLQEHWIHPEKQANYSIQTAGPSPVGPFSKTMYRKFWVPLNNRKVRYRGDNSPYCQFTDIGVMVLAYDAINTGQTDILTDIQWQSTFYYKDP